MKHTKLQDGAAIIVNHWMKVQPGETVLIITNERHLAEMHALRASAEEAGANVLLHIVPKGAPQDKKDALVWETLFGKSDVVIGATHYSIVTTKAVKKGVRNGVRFLSLPLATNDGRSLLEYNFLKMDPQVTAEMAAVLLKSINSATRLRVTTPAGTDLTFGKVGRDGSYFNGEVNGERRFASASFEVYVPIEEDKTFGYGVIDGSLGYLGSVEAPVAITLEQGRIVKVSDNTDGKRLQKYLSGFNDENLYHASEFGIGLNLLSHCLGHSYIEDESAYGTFHIGFGRNIALGGSHEANGHFDVIFDKPDIYADDRLIMRAGVLLPLDDTTAMAAEKE